MSTHISDTQLDHCTEEWRSIPDSLYEVSNHGRVRSPRQVLKPFAHVQGYELVSITYEHRPITKTVHGLVAAAFIGPRPEGLDVCHWDGDEANNVVSNLRYDTVAGNMADRLRHGTLYGCGAARHLEHVDAVRDRYAAGSVTHRELAAEFGFSASTVRRMVVGIGAYAPSNP